MNFTNLRRRKKLDIFGLVLYCNTVPLKGICCGILLRTNVNFLTQTNVTPQKNYQCLSPFQCTEGQKTFHSRYYS